MKLSHSSIKLFQECPKKYDYHYNQKIRPINKSSALFFGTAFDKAIEAKLKDRVCDEYAVFDKYWEEQEHNKRFIKLADSPEVIFSLTDFEPLLLIKQDILLLESKIQEWMPGHTVETAYNASVASRKQQKTNPWPEGHNRFYNLASWLCMRRKGHMMLDAHREHILPKIKKIVAVQYECGLNNDEGDSLIAFVDAIVEWEDGRKFIVDYKTASAPYRATAASESAQLAIYQQATGINEGGFIVFNKKLKKIKTCQVCGKTSKNFTNCSELNKDKKRCNGTFNVTLLVNIQTIFENLPEVNKTLETIEKTNISLKTSVYPKNEESCYNPYPCPYLKLCFKSSMEGLEKV